METGFLTCADLKIFYRCWPATDEQGVILCVHGLAGDSRIYSYLADKLSAIGYSVYAIDLPGYGYSDGEKGDSPFELTMKCMYDFVKQISEKHNGAKLFILGFSLGGMYSFWYASIHHEMVSGLIALAPHLRIEGVQRSPRSEPSNEVLSLAWHKYTTSPAQKIHIGMAVPNAFGETAGEEWIHMLKDPMCNFNYSFRYIFEVLIGRAEKVDQLYKLDIPMLILHGDQDWTTVPDQSRTFIGRSRSSDKELKFFPGSDHWFYHTVFYNQGITYRETDRMQVVNTILEWLGKRTVKKLELSH